MFVNVTYITKPLYDEKNFHDVLGLFQICYVIFGHLEGV